MAVASPKDIGRYGLPLLDAEALAAQARAALAGYTVTPLLHATLPALADGLRAGPAVLYLIGHGTLLEDGDSCLFLEGPDGLAAPARAAKITALIDGLAIRPCLIVLAACQSAGNARHARGSLMPSGPGSSRRE